MGMQSHALNSYPVEVFCAAAHYVNLVPEFCSELAVKTTV